MGSSVRKTGLHDLDAEQAMREHRFRELHASTSSAMGNNHPFRVEYGVSGRF